MSVAQHFALRIIGRQPGITMSDLAEATLTTRSAISEVVSRLYARGLLKRSTDPQDSRRIHLQLTPEGEQVWKTVGDAMPERLVAALLAMSLESRAQLASSLEEWVAEAHLTGVSPSMFGEHEHHAEKDLPVATE